MSDTQVVQQGRWRDPRMVGLVVAGAVAILLPLWFFVVGPLVLGDDDVAEQTMQPPSSPAGTSAQDPGDAETEQTLPVETYEVFLSRDPFEPVVPEPEPPGGTGGAGGTPTPGGAPGGFPGGSPGGGNTGGGGSTVQHNASLIDVFTDDLGTERALIRVGDTIYTLAQGDAFDDGYQLTAIQGTCVTFTYQGQSATLCEGVTSSSATTGCETDGTVVCDGREVSLVTVFTADGQPTAVVQVEASSYTVRRGDSFAQGFEATSVDPPCVTLRYGVETFTLCDGERVLK